MPADLLYQWVVGQGLARNRRNRQRVQREKIDPMIAVTEVSHSISGVNSWRVWLVGASIREPLGEYITVALQKLNACLEAFAAATEATLVVIPCNSRGERF